MPRHYKKKRKGKKLTLSKVNKKINNLLTQVEKKSYHSYQNYTAVTSTPTISDCGLSSITESSTSFGRVGQKIQLKSIQMKGQMEIGQGTSSSTNDNVNQIRLLLVKYDTHPTVNLTLSDILNTDVSTATPEIVMSALYQKHPEFKYRVLYDKVHTLYWHNSSGTTGGAPTIKRFTINRKLNFPVNYDGSTLSGQSLALIAVSDSSVITHPVMCYDMRINYTDL